MPYIGRAPTSTATKLEDADQDTKIQVEESSDEDTIRFDIAGAEDFTMTANTFTASSGSTIAAQALTATTIGSSGGVTITGTTPTLTIGDAGAEDTKIVFDGNAQDFYIGLDDTDDDLKIGLGSAVGTTAHMVFNEAGEVTKPLQPAFLVNPNAAQSNISVGGVVTLVFDSEIFDIGANFASNTFTAPVTGKYQINILAYFASMQIDSTYYNLRLITSNRTHYNYWNTAGMDAVGYQTIALSVFTDMDAGDTAYAGIYIPDGTAAADFNTVSSFSGFLAS